MNKIPLILKHEVNNHLSRSSFWIGLFAFPLLVFILMGMISSINRSHLGDEAPSPNKVSLPEMLMEAPADDRPMGIVDLSGLIRLYPPDFPHDRIIPYPDEETAEQAKADAKIKGYYVIPKNYSENGIVYDFTDIKELFSKVYLRRSIESGELKALLTYNLLDGDPYLNRLIDKPLENIYEYNLAPPEQTSTVDITNPSFMIPLYLVAFGFYYSMLGASTLFLHGMDKERENKLLEVLISSVKTEEFLTGKFLGLFLVGMLQTILWSVLALGAYLFIQNGLENLRDARVEPQLVIWAVIFYLLNFALYTSLLAGVGALVHNLRGASIITSFLCAPLYLPILAFMSFVQEPQGLIAMFLSFFPLTASTSLLIRMMVSQVPVWQPILASALLIVADFLIIRAVARMLRSQSILSGIKPVAFFKSLVFSPPNRRAEENQ